MTMFAFAVVAASALHASVDPGPDGRPRQERSRWQTGATGIDQQAATLMLAVERAFDANDPRAALEILATLRELRPRDPTVWNSIGYALVKVRDLPGAAVAYQKSVEVDANYAEGAYNLALAFIDLNKLDDARRSLEPWVARIREYPVLGVLLVQIEQARGHPAAARSFIGQVLAAPKIKPLVLFEAVNLLKNWNDPRAETAFRRVMSDAPEMIGAPLSLVDILRGAGRLKEARQVLDESAKRAPEHAVLLELRGQLNAQEGRLEEAVFDLDRAVAKKPELTRAALLAARCLIRLGRRRDVVLRLATLLDPARSVPPEEREAARRLRDELAPPQKTPAPDVRAIRDALEKDKDIVPRLDWLTWSSIAPSNQDRQPVMCFYIQGSGPESIGRPQIQISVWRGRDPWASGTRPRDCPTLRPASSTPPWAAEVARGLSERFHGVPFEVADGGTGHGGDSHRFEALGRPDVRTWLLIRAACGPGGKAGADAVVASAADLVQVASTRPLADALTAMPGIAAKLDLAWPRTWLRVLFGAPRGPPVLLDIGAYRDVAALVDGEHALGRPGDPPESIDGGPRTQVVEWLDGCPAVRGRERSTMKIDDRELPGLGDLAVYTGRFEIRLSSWSDAGIAAQPDMMKQILSMTFPVRKAVK